MTYRHRRMSRSTGRRYRQRLTVPSTPRTIRASRDFHRRPRVNPCRTCPPTHRRTCPLLCPRRLPRWLPASMPRCPGDSRPPWRWPLDRSTHRGADGGAHRLCHRPGRPDGPVVWTRGPALRVVWAAGRELWSRARLSERIAVRRLDTTRTRLSLAGRRIPLRWRRPESRCAGASELARRRTAAGGYCRALRHGAGRDLRRAKQSCLSVRPAFRRGPQGLRHRGERLPGAHRRPGESRPAAGPGRRADRDDGDSAGAAGAESGHGGAERLSRADTSDRPGKQTRPDRHAGRTSALRRLHAHPPRHHGQLGEGPPGGSCGSRRRVEPRHGRPGVDRQRGASRGQSA